MLRRVAWCELVANLRSFGPWVLGITLLPPLLAVVQEPAFLSLYGERITERAFLAAGVAAAIGLHLAWILSRAPTDRTLQLAVPPVRYQLGITLGVQIPLLLANAGAFLMIFSLGRILWGAGRPGPDPWLLLAPNLTSLPLSPLLIPITKTFWPEAYKVVAALGLGLGFAGILAPFGPDVGSLPWLGTAAALLATLGSAFAVVAPHRTLHPR